MRSEPLEAVPAPTRYAGAPRRAERDEEDEDEDIADDDEEEDEDEDEADDDDDVGEDESSGGETTDWGGGYCVELVATNLATSNLTTWNVTANIPGASTYTTWNATFSGSTGTVTIQPSAPDNQTLDAGETDRSIGFCANRANPASGLLPTIVSTSAN